MDKKKEEFLVRLRETFKLEASEHLDAITAGLLALERTGKTEHAAIVERLFRETHSLKGAARSVNLPDAEAMCQKLESVFAALKQGNLPLSTDMLDAIHPVLDVLGILCGFPGAVPTAADQEKGLDAQAVLERVIAGAKREGPNPKPDSDTFPPGDPGRQTPPSAEVPLKTAGQILPGTGGSMSAKDTVRVSTQKLGAILLETEELVGSRISASNRAAEIRELAASLADRNQHRLRQAAGIRRGLAGAKAAGEWFESELLYAKTLENALRNLAQSAHHDGLALAASVGRLLEDTKKLLMLPCSYLLDAMPKILRDLTREQGKEADLLLTGEDIEVDRRILDELKDPLIHLLRNCVDHGIEKPDLRRGAGKPPRGTVTVSVKPVEGNRVEVTVADDGAGIRTDLVETAAVRLRLMSSDEAVRLDENDVKGLIFQSGFSTSPIITDLSGRGLGLAIVREKVETLGGSIDVSSTPGAGTRFRMLLPLSQSTFRGVLVQVTGKRFVFPASSVLRVSRIKPDQIKTVENRQAIAIGERAVSLVRLKDVLDLPGPTGRADDTPSPVVVVRASDHQVAFLVDEVLGEQEVMVKSLGRQLVRVRNITGASIAGNGMVIPILNVADLVESASMAGTPGAAAPKGKPSGEQRKRLLIAEDSITARTLMKNILEVAGYKVVATVDGMDALTRLKTESFDLLVSDVDMPRMNGFELTTKIRADKNLCELPVVLVTALGSQQDREYGIEVGANAYIVKSDFDQANLLEIIQRLL